jgi:hypothetical protein
MGLIVQGQAANPTYLDGALSLDGALPDPLAGTVNNLNVSGSRFASSLLIRASEAVTLTGLTGGTPNKIVWLINQSAFTVSLTANDANSSAENRFAAAATIAAGTMIQLCYNADLALWIPLSGGSSSGAGPVILNSVISPAALAAGATSDYAPTDYLTSSVMRLTPNAAGSTLNSIVAPANGLQIVVFNVGAGDLTFAHNTGATAANRFACPGSVDYTVIANGRATIWYDVVSTRWRVQ